MKGIPQIVSPDAISVSGNWSCYFYTCIIMIPSGNDIFASPLIVINQLLYELKQRSVWTQSLGECILVFSPFFDQEP